MSGVEHKLYKRSEKSSVDLEPEHWTKLETQVLIACKHGHTAMIAGRGDGSDWAIDQVGRVSPSVWWKGTCECHIFVRLEGWTP